MAVTATVPGPQPAAATSREGPPAAAERIVIHGVGDILLCDCSHSPPASQGYDFAFSGMFGLFRRDALTIGNLECAPGRGGQVIEKPIALRCDPDGYPAMAAAGVDAVSLANNHAGDAGWAAMFRGMSDLEASGVVPFGAGTHRAQATLPAVFIRGGWSIAVVGFSAVGGGGGWAAGAPRDAGVAWWNDEVMLGVVRSLDRAFDIVIVSIHQGADNYTPYPSGGEAARGHALIDAGADVILAHHHHRVLPIETYHDRPIFWGLGDFVWPRFGNYRDESAVAEIVVENDGSITGRLIPALIVSNGHPVLQGLPDPEMRWQPPPAE
jgi:poly-gamma-glutamate synthesis protein (capsule biosynthesis protein)